MIQSAGNRMMQLVVSVLAGWLIFAGVLFLPVCQNVSMAAQCDYDQNGDGDTDGLDLYALTGNNTSLYLAEFALDFGRTDCGSSCRTLLPCSMDAANTCFAESAAATDDPVDRTFHAVTRILSLIYDPDINTMLTRLGMAEEVRTFCNWTAGWEEDVDGGPLFPETLPSSGEVLDLLVDKLMPEIEGALNELPASGEIVLGDPLNDPFIVLCEELQHPGDTGSCENIELDYGDIALYRAMLYFMKAFLIVIDVYDLDIEQSAAFIDAVRNDQLIINNYLCTSGPDCLSSTFLSPQSGAAMRLVTAKTAFRNAIDSYMEASDFIRNETDDQEDDLIAAPVDPDEIREEEEFRSILSDIKDSLSGMAVIGENTNTVDYPFDMDLTHFFDDPLDIRASLPAFTDDNEPICGSSLVGGLFDPTLNGILPGFDNDDWANGFGFRVAVTGEITCASGLACGPIYVGAFYYDWGMDSLGSSISGAFLSEPGTYSLPVWAGEDSVQVAAFWDANSDGVLSPGDYVGEYEEGPFEVESLGCAGPENINVIISEELIGISGYVTSNGQPVEGVKVILHEGQCMGTAASAETDENGYYVLMNDSTEPVYLEINAERHVGGHWNGTEAVSNCYQAAGYVPSNGGTTVNMSIEPADSISGTVRDAYGNSIPWAWVVAYDYDSSGYGNHSWMRGVSTDDNGYYQLYLNWPYSGTVAIAAEQGDGNYIREYYDSQYSPNNATPLQVLDPVSGEPHLSGIDFYLDQGGAISGFVVDTSENPLSDVWVTVWDSELRYGMSRRTQENGYYEVPGLPTGSYEVRTSANGYLSEYYDDADYSDYDLVSVTAPATTSGINFMLERSATISGTVVRSSDNQSLEEIYIYLYYLTTDGYQYRSGQYTSETGSYSFANLPAGTYKVQARDFSGVYFSQYYSNQSDLDSATAINLTEGQNAQNISFRLEAGSTITGYVYNAASAPLENIEVEIYDAITNLFITNCYTDENGEYAFTGLSAGDYKLGAHDSFYDTYAAQYYPDASDLASAETVHVEGDETVSGKDFHLETYPAP